MPPKKTSTNATRSAPADIPLQPFPTTADLHAFYDQHHTTLSSFYVKLAKKKSGIPSITVAEAVEVALCYGWIDGQGNTIDDTWWRIRFVPRRPKSMWSQKNVDTVERLTEQGRMRPEGLRVIKEAKEDGRWDRAYSKPSEIKVPEDLTKALGEEPKAEKVWEAMGRSERYFVLVKLEQGSPATRERRIASAVQRLAVQDPKANSRAEKQTPGTTQPASKRKRVIVDALPVQATKVTRLRDTPAPRREGLRAR